MNIKAFFIPQALDTKSDVGLLLLRLIAGFAMTIHGLQKMATPFAWMGPEAPVPGVLQFFAAFAEFAGGIAWIIGLLTPLASLGIGFTMLVGMFVAHILPGDPFVRLFAPPGSPETLLFGLPKAITVQGGQGGSWELAALYLVISAVLASAGPGRFSLDARFFRASVQLLGQSKAYAR